MLWRLKWRVSGIIADFMHVVLYDEGRDQPDAFGLLMYLAAIWALALGALAAVSSMGTSLLTVPAVILAGIMAILATITTVGTGWFLFEWFRRPSLFSGRVEP